jgi:flagellar protein FliS
MQGYVGGKAADQYLVQLVQGASPEQLVAMLLDGAQRFLNQVVDAINKRDIPTKARYVNRVSDIIEELILRLNHDEGGELVTNLTRIYEWWMNELFDASQKNQPERLELILRQMGEMRDTWEELHRKKSGVAQQQQAKPPTSLDGLIG